jgi:peptidoglycan/LPS O-acetylase OafA/YrhL
MNLLRDWRVWDYLHLTALDPWISYATVLILSFLAHHLVEKPARNLILRRFSSKPGTPTAQTSPQALPTQ